MDAAGALQRLAAAGLEPRLAENALTDDFTLRVTLVMEGLAESLDALSAGGYTVESVAPLGGGADA